MVSFVRGNLLRSAAKVLVIPVNTVGVAGKGLAKEWAKAYPGDAYYAYSDRCKAGRAQLGRVWHFFDRRADKVFVFFPTKGHWREKSDIGSIIEGLEDLRALIVQRKWPSIALPALGCGLGGLPWKKVCLEIEKTLGDIDTCNVMVYEPTGG